MKFATTLFATTSLFSASVMSTATIDKTKLLPWTPGSEKCTTIVVSKGAGTEGPMTTHTADCANCDFRINKVPPTDWGKDEKRALYVYKGSYPSQVIENRGTTWSASNLEGSAEQISAWLKEELDITGYIPQVPHTYGLYEAGYGIMNEHGLAMGESTCASWLWAAPTTAGGKAQVEVRELSKIALERTKKAREAIQLMGDLAVELGYYSAEWVGGDESRGEGGEALTVIDKDEAWVFHVTSDDTGTSAVWVAQRVPDGEVAVVANQFIIRDVIKGSPDFMYSPNLWEVAERAGLWKPSQGSLDFLKTFGPQRMHSPYATRRVWRVFTLLDPTLDIPAETDSYASEYPFSVKPTIKNGKIDKQDLMRLQRDHYEGSAYDLTKGLQSGPYGDPERWDAAASAEMTLVDVMQGTFERAISLFRTSYSFVAVSRKHFPDTVAPVLWFTQYAPASSSYTPFYVAARDAPRAYTHGSLFKYDPSVSFWNFAAAGNWANRWYLHTITTIQNLQYRLESGYARELEANDDHAGSIYADCAARGDQCDVASTERAVVDMLTAFSHAKGEQTVEAWRDLLPTLITQFHDGYHAENLNGAEIQMKRLFYPKWWLNAVGYFDNKPNMDPNAIMFSPSPDGTIPSSSFSTSSFSTFGVLVTVLLTSTLSIIAGFVLGRHYHGKRGGYMVINEDNNSIL